jgi:iron(III) transport system ATP-binding protein
MSKLTVADLWKGYSAESVLKGVDLDVPAGSLTAVLGLSGCGKTTLLRVIAGFERAQRGRVSLGARVLDDGHTYVPPERRGIGYVPQEGALFPHLTVSKNVGFGLSREERKGSAVTELLEMVGLASLADRYPHQLSGGEQQRVALARALARKPEVLLLDEPFSSLDASLRTRVREEVHALLRAQGVTTVLVTHDQEEALSLADTVAVLRDGLVIQDGTPDQLYTRPADVELAQFLGAVNLIDADFADGVARTALGPLALRSDSTAGGSAADDSPGGNGTGGGPPGVGSRGPVAPTPQQPASGSGVVMVRPEQLVVHPRGESHGASIAGVAQDPAGIPAGVAGEVEQCRYYGHDALLHVRLAQLDGSGAAQVLLARVQGEQALPEGTQVLLAAYGPVTIVE